MSSEIEFYSDNISGTEETVPLYAFYSVNNATARVKPHLKATVSDMEFILFTEVVYFSSSSSCLLVSSFSRVSLFFDTSYGSWGSFFFEKVAAP